MMVPGGGLCSLGCGQYWRTLLVRLVFYVTPPPVFMGTFPKLTSIGDEFNLQNAKQHTSIKNMCKENL